MEKIQTGPLTQSQKSEYVNEEVYETEMILGGYGSTTGKGLGFYIIEATEGQRDELTALRDTLNRILEAPDELPLT